MHPKLSHDDEWGRCLRLVNGAPFPSRNLGPWMTVFARPNRGG